MEFSWWALRKDCSFLHSAAVGTDGAGVLISGVGGSGKSTLSMSAMLEGLDLLSDDYMLVRTRRPAKTDPASLETDAPVMAYRLYSSGYLKNDTLEKLPEFRKYIYWTSERRNKSLIDMAACSTHEAGTGSLIDRLSLRAVVFPHIDHAEEACITPCPDVRRLIPLLASTSYQNRELRSKEVFLDMMTLLKNLPVYDFYLTDDIRRNAVFLKEWIRKL